MGKVLEWWIMGCWSAVDLVFASWTLPLYGKKSFFPGNCVEGGRRWLRCMGEMIKSYLWWTWSSGKGINEPHTSYLLLVA